MRNRFNTLALGALLAGTALASPALAQDASTLPFPVRQYADKNGVDLLSGVFTAYTPAIIIGSPDMGLSYLREVRAAGFRDTTMGNISVNGTKYTVGIAGGSEVFTSSGGTFTPDEQNGSTLTFDNGTSTYTYTRSDSTVAQFVGTTTNYTFGNAPGIVLTSLTYPSGRSLAYHFVTASYADSSGTRHGRRLQSVTTNAGYHMKLSYKSDTATDTTTAGQWGRVSKVKGLNSATDPCGVTDPTCPQTGRPKLTVTEVHVNNTTYTDAENRTTSYTFAFIGLGFGKAVTAIKFPGSASNNITISYTDGKATSVTNRSLTTGYDYSDSSGIRTVTITHPGGSTRVVTFDIAKSLMLSETDELGRTTSYQYDSNNRLTRVTRSEGNYTQLTYDGRGNVTETRAVAKSGSGLADVVATAAYPASCSNPKTCNKPNSTTDPRGNVTDFTYDSTHGGLLTATAPAPSGGANRPQTRISYTRLDANGAPSATGIIVPTGSSTCQTGTAPSCVGTADEVKTTAAFGYGLLPSSVSSGAGDASLTATQAMTYDAVGNLLTVDGPLAGTADTTRTRWDLNRQVVGVIGPDPDDAGALKHRAVRTTYGASGLVTKVERGTVNSQSDADWAAFVSLEEVQQDYDPNRRPTVQRLVSGGTSYALTQTSFDSRGRVDCVAARMNTAIYGSLPASACTLGTQGSHGPDRINKSVYDAASQVTQLQVAVGTTDAANERTLTYTSNGRLQTLKDAESNLTTYEYDGHDRLSKTRMPNTIQGSGTSSTTDYEQLTYDAASNVTNRRLRDAQNIGFTYDNLNRVTLKNLPGAEPDVTYAYDNLGRLTSASQTGNILSFSYDALGRNLTQVGPQGTVASQWDLAGRRTKLTYPGSGLFVDYDYLVTGEMTKVRENGATSGVGVLVTLAYDDLGRRTSLTRGNGTVTSYGFDPVSRLATLAENFTGTANDQSATFNYSPASQISSLTKANDAYAWTGHGNGSTASVANGLNQLTSIDGVATTHDTKGNLAADPTTGKAHVYSSENLLISSSGGTAATLAYDPAMRLHQLTGATTTRFAYDGLAMIAEYDGSNVLQRRFVHGPGVDDPLVKYEGSGTTDRRWMHADERGSVIAISDGSGTVTTINRYDEYGKPHPGNAGRFQYTGQMWLGEVGIYYYKARMYSPTFGGRFLQTDPIRYGGGINLYAYVLNDPVNKTDPTGLACSSYLQSHLYGDVNDNRVYDSGDTYEGGEIYASFCSGDWLAVAREPRQPGRGSGGPFPPLPNPQSDNCVGPGFAAGGFVGASAEAGIFAVGAGAQGQLSYINFGMRGALLKTTGSFIGGPGYGASSPSTGRGGAVLGGTIGAEAGLIFSNAQTPSDLAGNATTLNINVGPVALSGSLSENGIFTLSGGPSLGASFAVSIYDAHTDILNDSGC